MMATITGTGCMSSRDHGLLPRRRSVAVRGGGSGSRRLRGGRGGRGAWRERAGVVPRQPLRRALRARSGNARCEGADRVRVHAIVADLDTARRAVDAGATVVQLRVKGPTAEVVERGQGFRGLGADVRRERRRRRCARARRRRRPSRSGGRGRGAARRHGLLLGRSATTYEEAIAADADYLGVGPIWETPSKADAAAPLGLDELARICAAVSVPVVAIGGIDALERSRLYRGGRLRCGCRSGLRATRRSGGWWMRLSELGELGLLGRARAARA